MALLFHPLANLFPLIEGAEFEALVADVKAHGIREPIWRYEDKTLDGRNRERAAQAAGVDCPTREYSGDDPLGFVVSANLHRRHLTAEDKRKVIAKLLKAQPEQSNRTIAKQVKADDKTVAKVRRELESTADIPQLDQTVGADGKARKLPAKRKTDDPKLAALRERAAQHGLRIRKRGLEWVLIDADGKSEGSWYSTDADDNPIGGDDSGTFDIINYQFDVREGKVPQQVYTHCGRRIDGFNNSKAWLAAHPGATMEDFERALKPALIANGLAEQTTLQSNVAADDAEASADAHAEAEQTPLQPSDDADSQDDDESLSAFDNGRLIALEIQTRELIKTLADSSPAVRELWASRCFQGLAVLAMESLLKRLAEAKKARRNAIRAQRKIYHGHEPCAERKRNPLFDAAVAATEKANANYNAIVDQINAMSSDQPTAAA